MGEIRDRMIADLTIGGYSNGTRDVYVWHATQFAKYFRRSPAEMCPAMADSAAGRSSSLDTPDRRR